MITILGEEICHEDSNTINDICTDLNSLANLAGGDHLDGKEIEEILHMVSNNLYVLTMNLSNSIVNINSVTGVSERHRFLYNKQKNIKENEKK